MLFSEFKRPVITMMLKDQTEDGLFRELEKGLKEGADAFGISIGGRDKKFGEYAFLRKLFSQMEGKPIYFTNYRRGNLNPNITDEELTEGLLTGLEAGATLIDLPGDHYYATPGELTYDEVAIQKQMDLINEIHNKNAEVLMSSHVLKYIPKEEVLQIALEHKKRGADISKIVTNADTEQELIEAMEASLLLRRKANIPHLFICNGETCRLHRRLSPYLGSCLYLVTEDEVRLQNQPRISEILDSYHNILNV